MDADWPTVQTALVSLHLKERVHMSIYRFVLQGCNEDMLAEVNKAALAGIPGVKLPIDKRVMGHYFISVDSELSHLKVLEIVQDAFTSLLLTVCPTTVSASNFADLA
jgi:hypothetical protein